MRPCIILLIVVLASATPGLTQCPPVYTFTGEGPNDYLGSSVSGAGDVNNDGYGDIVVGARGYGGDGPNQGRVYVYSGLDGDTLHIFTGEAGGDWFGRSVAVAGDVNNDGYSDIIVGAYGNSSGGYLAGRAYVFSGLDGSTIYTFTGEAAEDRFGWSVSGAGDLNGDGFADVVVGAMSNDAAGANAGRAYTFSGLDGSALHVFTGEAEYDHLGDLVCGVGDVNNDGFDDIAVGANGNDAGGINAGRAYVFSGIDGDTLYVFTGTPPDQGSGGIIVGVGDVNADGFDDLAIVEGLGHDPADTNMGRVFVVSGVNGDTLHALSGDTDKRIFGWPVCSAGDVNNDGHPDICVGADGILAEDGSPFFAYLDRIYIFSGLDGQQQQVFTNYGLSVSSVGDIDNDGFDDIVIGAYTNSEGGSLAGQAYVFSLGTACPPCCTGLRGDANGDQSTNVADITYLVSYIFQLGSPPSCFDEADLDASAFIDLADLIYIVDYLFFGGTPPAPCR